VANTNLQLHEKYVSLGLLFFLMLCRSTAGWSIPDPCGSQYLYPCSTSGVLPLLDYDNRGDPAQLFPGLGDLPLHPDKDGWYSVLGPWSGNTDYPDLTNKVVVGGVNLEINPAIPAVTMPPRPSLQIIFCQ